MEGESKQNAIFQTLRKNILEGRYASGRFPSERALMRRFDVSRSLLRIVLRELRFEGFLVSRQGSGTFVAKGARNLGHQIGLIVPGARHEEIFSPICRAISNLAQREGFMLLFSGIDETDPAVRAQRIRSLVDEYARLHVSGVIYQPLDFLGDSPKVNEELLYCFKAADIPVVLLDYDIVASPERSEYDLVGIDNFEAGRRICEHLVSVGAKRIAFMLRDNWAMSVYNRMNGVRVVADAAGCLAPKFELNLEPNDFKGVAEMMKGRRAPDAIVCGNDNVAAQLLVTLRKLGIDVPGKIRVAGFDDVAQASLVEPPLTTIHQPCDDIARSVFEVLLQRIRTPDRVPRTVYLNAPLVIRNSTR